MLKEPHFLEPKKVFSSIFRFSFLQLHWVCSIHTIKVRTIASHIVSEKAKFRVPVSRKKMRVFSVRFWKKNFFVLRFSQNQFLTRKTSFSPFFFKMVRPIGLKIFLWVIWLKWGAFFLFKMLFLKSLAAFRKLLTLKKHGFWQCLQYFASPDVSNRYFSKRQETRTSIRS
jgi:hypothetical protein